MRGRGAVDEGWRAGVSRVAFFVSAFHPSLGGVEELVRQLALEYQRRGVAVVVVTNRWPRNLPACEWIEGIRVLRFAFRMPDGLWRAKLGFYLTAATIFRKVLRHMADFNPDVVHVQCVSANGWYAVRVAEALRIPLVVSAQGERTMDAQRIYERSPVMNRVLLRVLRAADRVTACSQASLEDLVRYDPVGVDRATARVVYNGIGREAFGAEAKGGVGKPFLLALGRLVPQKGFDTLLKAFAASRLATVELVLAGDGVEFDRLCALKEELGLGGKVRMAGRVDRAGVHALMRESVGVLVPSLREPMGIVVLEALAAGKPLAVSGVDGILEVIPTSEAVRVVPPGNVPQWAEAVLWLAGFGAGGCLEEHVHHARRFCWETIVDQYFGIYADCLRDRAPRLRPETNGASNQERIHGDAVTVTGC